MKKLFTLFTFVFFSLTVLAENVVVDDIKYSIDYGKREATVIANTSWNGYSGEVVIPASITALGMEFSVTGIGKNAFSFCPDLTSITIPNTITSIDKYAFYESSRLTSVNITDLSAWCKIEFGVYSSNPLYYAKKLFLNGEEVKDLVVPDDVTSIGKYAFISCSGLTSVTIPNSVTSIGDWAFFDCSGLTSVTIPNSVTSIGEFAFQDCSGLTNVTFGNSVESIGGWALAYCKNLENVYCLAENVPTTDSSAFFDVDYCTLYVPKASIDEYKATEPWSRFSHILSLEDAPDIPTTISSVNGVNTTKSQIYCLDGTRFNTFQHGINIIKTAKGIKKVMK